MNYDHGDSEQKPAKYLDLPPMDPNGAISDYIQAALESGVSTLIRQLKVGPTSHDGSRTFGKGWHDFYLEGGRTAGAHASMEGYLLCKRPAIARRLTGLGFNPDDSVFDGYLLPLFDRKDTRDWPTAKEDQRAEAEVTTTKLAKFAQCCAASRHPRSLEFANRTFTALSGAKILGTNLLSHTTNSHDSAVNPPSPFATAEALRAQCLWAKDFAERYELLCTIRQILSPLDDPLSKSPWLLESIPWLKDALPLVNVAFTTFCSTLAAAGRDDPLVVFFIELLECFLRHEYFLMGDFIIETYSFKDADQQKSRTDYVSYESTLYLIQAVLSAIGHELCSDILIELIQPNFIAWQGSIKRGYCIELTAPEEILPQKNRFSYVVAILHTLSIAEDALKATTRFNQTAIPMFVNPTRFPLRGIVPDGTCAFLAIPFTDDPSAKEIEVRLKSICSDHGFKLSRTDDLRDTRIDIPLKIWGDICKSSFMIAVCNNQNPNVYYEVGLAHAIGKPVFLCAASSKDFTFDVTGIDHCIYTNPGVSLEATVGKFIERLKAPVLL